MDSRERIITALELKQPDQVPSFFEGMMPIFKENFLKLYEDSIDEKDVLYGNFGDLTIYKYLGVDSVWLHSSPIKMGKLSIDYSKIQIEDEKTSVGRWGTIHKQSIVMGRPHSYYRGGYLDTEDKWKQWIDAGYFDYEIDNSWIRLWEKAYPEALKGGIILVPVDTTWEKNTGGNGNGSLVFIFPKKKLISSKVF